MREAVRDVHADWEEGPSGNTEYEPGLIERTPPRRIFDGQLLSDAFERFPYGIMIASGGSRVVAANDWVERLTGLSSNTARSLTCCDVLGCRRPRTPLEGVCLTELVMEAHEQLTDVLLDLPHGSIGAVWVTAAPLYDDASSVVYELRPAAPEALRLRPRLTDDQPHLKVYALGPLRVTSRSGPLDGEWQSQRAGKLFKYLVANRHHVAPLETMAEAVWPNARLNTSNTVRRCIHVLRSRLDPDAAKLGRSPYILSENGGYRLNPDLVSVDVDDFERAVSMGLRALANGDSATATARFGAAVEMYRDDFLVDEPYEEWALLERERLRERVTIPLRALVELHADDPDLAIDYLERLAQMEPLDNEVQRKLIMLLVSQGRRSRAVRQYNAFGLRLLRTFNEAPSFTLAEIVTAASQPAD